jgi:hypothetical protein
MKANSCPQCNGKLVESIWEHLEETKDGGVIMDASPVYRCQENCGFMKRIEPIPQIIGQQGDDRLLLLFPNERGRILDLRNSIIWPPNHVESLKARGYWDEYTGNHDAEALLEDARESESAFLEPPNLFYFATSELSQDAFLCWFLSWSKYSYRSINRPLHEAAFNFIAMIFNAHKIPVPTIETIEITRQFESLDILAIVNKTYAILIEDKTFTKDHSNQLIRYRESVKIEYPKLIQLPIYYKISDQSHFQSVKIAGYIPFKRRMMMGILKKGIDNGVNNSIFLDYYQHLNILDENISSYKITPVANWDSFAWQGFYQELQEEIPGNWGYVPNKAGGFWAFWWKSKSHKRYYFQLEQQRLCVKLKAKDGEEKREIQHEQMEKVLSESEKSGLSLKKPSRLKIGKTMTIAMREDYIKLHQDGTVNIKGTIEELKKY